MDSPSEAGAGIIEAAAGGYLEKLKEMKESIGDDDEFRRRCDLVGDGNGQRVLHYAAGMGFIHICRFLVEEVGVNVDIRALKGDTPLLNAVRDGHVNTAKYLIKRGAAISMSDSKGFNPLHYAAQRGNKELMKLLLIKGADIEANSVGGTPLQCAASFGSVETVKFLLDHGAKANSFCRLFGCSPLICAIISHSHECTELLLKAGVDPNTSLCGLSPLAHAAVEGQMNCIKSLLAAGADPDQITSYGLTPIEHAALESNREAVRVLFPVTPRLQMYPEEADWTIDGIMEFIFSERAESMRNNLRKLCIRVVKHNAKDAWNARNYSSAVGWYSEAIYLDPSDEKTLSNRSICWARIGEATFALRDAEECVRLKPDWAKAHYREGTAWQLLKNYGMSCDAFRRALTLAPQNEEIERAFRESLRCLQS